MSSAVFFKGDTGSEDPASLFDAYALLGNLVGKRTYTSAPFSLSRLGVLGGVSDALLGLYAAAAILFALALLASGQSSSIIATLAGQIVSEGFIRWRLSVSLILPSRPHVRIVRLTHPFIRVTLQCSPSCDASSRAVSA